MENWADVQQGNAKVEKELGSRGSTFTSFICETDPPNSPSILIQTQLQMLRGSSKNLFKHFDTSKISLTSIDSLKALSILISHPLLLQVLNLNYLHRQHKKEEFRQSNDKLNRTGHFKAVFKNTTTLTSI